MLFFLILLVSYATEFWSKIWVLGFLQKMNIIYIVFVVNVNLLALT